MKDFICYHQRTKIVLGIGATPQDAIVDARWNAAPWWIGPDGIDETDWATVPATEDLIHEIGVQGGDLSWAIINNIAICV